MSIVTKPNTEFTVTCGFYNSLNGDRKYDVQEVSSIFDGIIADGIFITVGDALVVTEIPSGSAYSDGNVLINTGRCWFDHSWTNVDGAFPIDCGAAHGLMTRIDAVVLRVDSSTQSRDNTFEVIKGTPATNPVKPKLANDGTVHEYALCYITRKPGVNAITQDDIEDVRGNTETPFVTGVLDTIDVSNLRLQWVTQFNNWLKEQDDYAKETLHAYIYAYEQDFTDWSNTQKALMENAQYSTNVWIGDMQNTIYEWFYKIVDTLDDDPAINLQMQIDEIEIERLLIGGLPDGVKTMSNDGMVITTIGSNGRKLVKVFTDGFTKCTTTLYSSQGGELGSLVKTFGDDGSISTEMNILTSVPNGDEIEY